jgi:hypothetical protein
MSDEPYTNLAVFIIPERQKWYNLSSQTLVRGERQEE